MRRLDVVLDPRGVWGELRGYRARDLLVEVGSRPVFNSRARAWSSSARHAADAASLAETRGYVVTVSKARETS